MNEPLPVPADFADFAPGKPLTELGAHYGVCADVLMRWRKEAGVAHAPRSNRFTKGQLPPPDNFAALAPTMTRYAATQHFGRGHAVVDRWAAETGTIFRRATGNLPRGERTALDRHQRDMSLAGQAADYLRKVAPVWRCDADGRALHDGFFWRWAGRAVLGDDEIMAMARRKGWDPDAWRKVAA